MRNAAVLVAAIAAGSIQTFTLGAIEAEAAAAPPTRVVVLADPGIAAPPAAVAVRIDDRSSDEIAKALRALPAGERMLFSDRLLATLFDHPRDRVIVRGHLTDHASPWPTNGVEAVAAEMRRLAEDLRRLDAAPDTLIVIGDLPLRFETIDAAGESYWMSVRNDPRFAAERSETFHLTGTITSGSEQALQWDAFLSRQAHGALFEAVQRPIVAAFPTIELAWASQEAAAIPTAPPPNLFGTVRSPRFDATYPLTAAAETSTWEVFRAAVQRADADASLGAMLPLLSARSDGGTRVRRLALAGTPLWDELARHLLLRSGGRLVVDNRRGGERAAEDAKLLATIAGEIDPLRAGSARHLDGDGFVATGAATAAGDTLWRVTLAPGVRSILLDLGTDEPMRISAGADGGAWFRSGGSAAVEVAALDRAPSTARSGSGRVISVTGEPVPDGVELLNPVLANWSGAGFGDLNGDGVIDGADLAIWLGERTPGGSWDGTPYGDLNGDGVINGADLAIWLAGQGGPNGWQGTPHGDLDGDGTVGGADLAIWLAGQGGTGGWQGTPYGDLDGNGTVGGADLAIWLAGQGGTLATPAPVRIRITPSVGPRLDDAEMVTIDETDSGSTEGAGGGAGGGYPPQVDPTIPITPPSQPGGAIEGTPVPVPTGFSFLINQVPDPSQEPTLVGLGLEPVYIVYQGVDPNAEQSGVIDAERVATRIRTALGPNASGWLMLDFEVPFLAVIRDGPEHPAYEQTVQTMNALVHRVRSEFPQLKITHYGLPTLPYWLPAGGSWAAASPEYRAEMVARYAEHARPVLDPLDWISPTVYDRYDAGMYTDAQRPNVDARERAFRVATMDICDRYQQSSGLPRRPTIPSVSPTYAPGGTVQYPGKLIPIDELLRDQVDPLLEAGADGVLFWHTSVSMIHQATSEDSGQARQTTRRTAISRNLLGADTLLSAEQLQGLGFSGWNCMALRQHLLADMTSRISVMASHVNARVLQLHPASASPSP